MLTISSGYDPGYLTRAVATGRENYYLSSVAEHGEPPGIWTGLGCPELGLAVGSQVDPRVMERLYGAFIDPRDPAGKATLGRAPSGFGGNDDKVAATIARLLAAEPEATGERRDQLVMQALKERRAAVFFFDATFSVPKSVSLLHASLQVRAPLAREAGQVAEAERWDGLAATVWDGIMVANQAMLDYLQREAGYSRAGYHSKDSGRFADAHEWVIASFAQHTSRDNDPQLHVHNAILNRVLRDDPLAARPGDRRAWRTLDGAALYAVKPAAGAIAERTLAEYLTERLGVETIARPDGNGWEIAGVSEATRDLFSSRRRAIEPRLHALVEEYERRHGKAPNARAVWSMAQFVTLDSREPKAHSVPGRDTLLARWEAHSRRAEVQALSAIPDAALGRREPGAATPSEASAEIDRVLAAAVADALYSESVFTRYELLRMINRYLPGYLGGLGGGGVSALLEELTSQALRPGGACGVVRLTAPEMVPVPDAFRRADGLSLWRRHGAEVFTTRGQLDVEARLLRAAAHGGAPAIAPERAAAALGADRARIEARLWCEHAPNGAVGAQEALSGASEPLSGVGLADDQAQAAYGILTSGRAIDILVGSAGTGKTRTVAVLARIWQEAGTMRAELEGAASLATLAPMWADVTRVHATRRYEAVLRSLVPAAEWERYEQDPERGTLTRLLRAAELAGHDVDDLLRRAVEGRGFGGARSVAAVLHGRVRRLVGVPEPIGCLSYVGRTPVIDDPDAARFAAELAAAMDERAALLGNRVAADRPVWALRYLGEVSADPAERAEWVARAGFAAAYREERSYASEVDAIGPAPERGSPELRASWHVAYAALRLPELDREVALATDGELYARRAAYEREAAWAPPYVAAELREAHIAEDTYRADAMHAWFRADTAIGEAERESARREAEAFSALAQEVGARREALTEIAEARRAWLTATELDRQRAVAADSELRRRHPGIELPPLHAEEERELGATEMEADEPVAEQACAARLDIETALASARQAQQIIAERERQPNRDAELDGDDLMRRREAEAQQEAAARRDAVRQEPLPSRRIGVADRESDLELEAGQ